jgi:(4S)-4-hydroxy-5-phosphonooxypentane-2,3-dione isomerase
MFIVHVFVHVVPGLEEPFMHATLENARNSVSEPGIARFDVLQEQGAANKFVLVEVYRTEADAGKHKETAHYLKWRDTVADMMAEPRSSIKFDNLFPDEEGWG